MANDETGISELLRRLETADLVTIEATGGLEVPVASALATAGIAVAVVNPRQVRDFARATGQLAETDALDAQVLARFGEAVKPQVRALRDAQAQALEALVNRRRQLVEMLTAEKNRRANSPKVIHKALMSTSAGWKSGSPGSTTNSPLWSARPYLARARRVAALGARGRQGALDHPARALAELGALNRKQIAALVGLAPFNRDSGSLRGSCCIWGGRAQVRRVLYMVVVAAVRSNPVIKNFNAQLRARGKYPKSALTACTRKLLVILNAMLRSKISWQTPALASSTTTLSPLLGAVPEHGCCASGLFWRASRPAWGRSTRSSIRTSPDLVCRR